MFLNLDSWDYRIRIIERRSREEMIPSISVYHVILPFFSGPGRVMTPDGLSFFTLCLCLFFSLWHSGTLFHNIRRFSMH